MAIDTAFKRRSSAASRRMPWQRRFGIAPTGTIGIGQRMQGVWVYGGIEPAEQAPPVVDVEGLQAVIQSLSMDHVVSRSISALHRTSRTIDALQVTS